MSVSSEEKLKAAKQRLLDALALAAALRAEDQFTPENDGGAVAAAFELSRVEVANASKALVDLLAEVKL